MPGAKTPGDFREALRLSGAYSDLTDDQARDAMIMLGIAEATEKPGCGTWNVVTEGVYSGQYAYVNGHGALMVFTHYGDYDVLPRSVTWPSLTPASVVRQDRPIGHMVPAISREKVWTAIYEAGNATEATEAVMSLLQGGKE